MTLESTLIKESVKNRYGSLAEAQIATDKNELINNAQTKDSCCGPVNNSCCTPTNTNAKPTIRISDELYEQTQINNLPTSVTDISLGCGNPTAIASLKAGETVLDLGSGGGIDCFLAAENVGPTGYVIGVDMTDNMLALANKNKNKLGISNVEFRKGEIENLPVDDNSIDIIISNCVINLSPDKDAVFREAFRVLKPGGRLAVSDIVTTGHIPEILKTNMSAWVGCTVGALDQDVYLQKLQDVGFKQVTVQGRKTYGPEMIDMLDEEAQQALLSGIDISILDKNTGFHSANIVAYKPS